jgi:5-methylcytosine-specific restriction endonuclease McrA
MNQLDRDKYLMREPCKRCSDIFGHIVEKGGQDTVRCLTCNKHCYNAPCTETGRELRTTQTVHSAIKPKQRIRILLRDGSRCVICGRQERDGITLQVGHVVSVDTGLQNGLTELELNNDENLACICIECNLGLGNESLPLRVLVRIQCLRARLSETSQPSE